LVSTRPISWIWAEAVDVGEDEVEVLVVDTVVVVVEVGLVFVLVVEDLVLAELALEGVHWL
jgi:hypothetical protein